MLTYFLLKKTKIDLLIIVFISSTMGKETKESKAYTAGGLVFVGPLMIGIGLGIYYNITAVGVMVGLGVGFVLFGIVYALINK